MNTQAQGRGQILRLNLILRAVETFKQVSGMIRSVLQPGRSPEWTQDNTWDRHLREGREHPLGNPKGHPHKGVDWGKGVKISL